MTQIRTTIRPKPDIYRPSQFIFGRFFTKSHSDGIYGGKNPYYTVVGAAELMDHLPRCVVDDASPPVFARGTPNKFNNRIGRLLNYVSAA